MQEKNRIQHFDILKGIAIFLVVMGHVLTMCIRDIDRTLLFKIIGQIHMPVFFFISGYFTYKLTSNGKLRIPAIGSRFRQLVIPGVLMGLIWMKYFPHSGLQSPFDMSFNGMWLTEYKNGYWFTIVLFEIIILYSCWSLFLNQIKSTALQIVSTIIFWAFLIWIDSVFEADIWWKLLSLKLVVTFFPAFMAGFFAKKYGEQFTRFCLDSRVYTVSLLLSGFLVYLIVYPWDFPGTHNLVFIIAEPLMHISVAITGINLVSGWCEKAFNPEASVASRRFIELWKYIGSQSLAIYLLHYFFLFPLPVLQEPLRGMALDMVPTLVVSVVIAAAIVAVTLLVNIIISKSPFLAWITTGKSFNFSKK